MIYVFLGVGVNGVQFQIVCLNINFDNMNHIVSYMQYVVVFCILGPQGNTHIKNHP